MTGHVLDDRPRQPPHRLDVQWSVPPYEIFRRELTIKGSFAQAYSFDRALLMLRNGQVDPTGMITHRFALAEYGAALEMSGQSECVKAVIAPHGP